MRNDFETNYLEHSAKGTTWTKKGAKYLKRVWKNGKWVYQYKITGKGYLNDASDARRNSQYYTDRTKSYSREKSKYLNTIGVNNASAPVTKYYDRHISNLSNKASTYGRKAAEATSNYYTKSLAGVTESTIKKGQATISSLLDSLKPKTTVKITTSGNGNLVSTKKKKK